MTNRVAMVGSGLIGTGWAVVFARAGWDVSLYDIKEGRAHTAIEDAKAALLFLEHRGELRSAAECSRHLHEAVTLEQALDGATYVQENVLETPEEKPSRPRRQRRPRNEEADAPADPTPDAAE